MNPPGTTTAQRLALGPLLVLSAAQFLMVLDQSVMNVSISQLVADFDTDVTTIQGVITLYSLVMAALMVTGGKIGDLIGRRRTFLLGLTIYGMGSALTAVSWSVPTLVLGWSLLEGIGAALVMPSMVALVAGNFAGKARAAAFGVIGGMAGVGIAVGPIVGGYFTTELSWRWVFVGEVLVVAAILVGARVVGDAPVEGRPPRLDGVGAGLSAMGLSLVVIAILQASTWGWVAPKESPVEPLGFSLTPFVLVAGILVLGAFVSWQRHREKVRRDPLVHLDLLRLPDLRSGLLTFSAQNLILMGTFFVIPLYLQIVQGLSALDTGIRMLPVSVTMFVAAMLGPRLVRFASVRTIVRTGIVLLVIAALVLISAIEPDLGGWEFGLAMALLGIGMGLVASQLGNVVQSAVDEDARGEAGGLQFTAQQFGASLGVALIGAIVITGLATSFSREVTEDPAVGAQAEQQVSTALTGAVSFLDVDSVEAAARDAGISDSEVVAITADYETAQLRSLKAGLLAVAGIAALSILGTRGLPARREPPTNGADDDDDTDGSDASVSATNEET